jgi:hypothetical protein
MKITVCLINLSRDQGLGIRDQGSGGRRRKK